jgi:hypothetical protein
MTLKYSCTNCSFTRTSLSQGLCDPRRHVEFLLIDVTPGPPLAALERGHHRMGRVLEMFRGMSIGRAVATADMTTGQAETEMHPGRSNVQAFFTTDRASRHRLNSSHVWTGHASPPWAKNNEKVPFAMIVIFA